MSNEGKHPIPVADILSAASLVSIIATDSNGLITMFNTGAERLLGYSAEEIVGKCTPEKFHLPEEIEERSTIRSNATGDEINGFSIFIDQALNEGPSEQEWTYVTKNDTHRQVRLAITALKQDDGSVGGFLGIGTDVTELKNTEQALHDQQRLMQLAIDNIPQYIFWKDTNLVYQGCNKNFATVAGVANPEKIAGKTDYDLAWNQKEADFFRTCDRRVMNTLKPEYHIIEPQKHADGKQAWLDTNKVPMLDDDANLVGILGTFEDITERLRVEEELRQSQKLDAIGKLASGIAHDFNNMLGGILGSAELLQRHLANDPVSQKYIAITIKSAQRAADLSNKLLAFSRQQTVSSTPIDLHTAVSEAVAILENTIDKRVHIKTDFNTETSMVVGDKSQLMNVFLNLGINAAHAMETGGILSFESKLTDLTKTYCEVSPFELNPGPHIHVEVRDTGCGISQEIIHNIFDPFFTTKEQGKGTGLGLAAAYGTIQQHKGAVAVYSEKNIGTCFHLYFPTTEELAADVSIATEPILGQGNILLVDDEYVMRVTGEAMLKEYGYDVITATNGVEAVDLYKQNSSWIDLVVLDMVMPKMDGRDCFKAIKKYDPTALILISSGFSRSEDLRDLKKQGMLGFIQKPFRGVELSRIVAEALEETPQSNKTP